MFHGVMRSPSRPTDNGERAAHFEGAESAASALRFVVPGNRAARLTRYSITESSSASTGTLRSFVAFALHAENCGAVVGGADVADIGLAQLLSARASQECVEDERGIAFRPISFAIRATILRDGFQERYYRGPGGEPWRAAWRVSVARRAAWDWRQAALPYRGRCTIHSRLTNSGGSSASWSRA